MAFKPNYRQQRADRDRAKAQKKDERLKRREISQSDAEPSQSVNESTGVGSDTSPAPTAGKEPTD